MQPAQVSTRTDNHSKVYTFFSYINNNLEKPIIITGLIGSILLIVYQSLGRYIFSKFIPWITVPVWTEELARFLYIWASYMAIPVTIRLRSSIRVDVIYDKLSPKVQGISWIVVDLAFMLMSACIFYTSLSYLSMQLEYHQYTAALRIPYYIPYFVLPLAFGLMSLRLLQDLVKQAIESGFINSCIGVVVFVLLCVPVFFSQDINVLWLLFGYFLVMLFLGVPIAICLGLAALATIVGADTLPIDYVAQIPFTSIDSMPIMAIPFFITAGVLMGAGGLSKRILDLADYLLGSLPGGIALVSIGASMFFAAISGSGPATVAAIGMITIPAMIERGYDKYFASCVVAAAGAIGVMIPPSNPFVVYGVTAQESIGKLFMGGIIPGILTGLGLMIYAYFYSKKKGWLGVAREKNTKEFIRVFWEAKWALLVPVIVLGGIYGGIMTPTEAAAVGSLYGFIAGMFLYRELSFKKLFEYLQEAGAASAAIIILIAMATLFGNIMAIESVPDAMATLILSITNNKILVLLMINLFLLFVGTFMEALAAILILTPILLPIVVKLGVNPVHFGVIMVVNLAIGFVTPPVGVNLFVASSISKSKLSDLAVAILPFLAIMIAVLFLITYVPALPMMFIN
ncbi:TRAP transporter large permease subunit [Desulfovibrio litoralis]|uniref:C4-dicarboxylate transporter, DctM subunit n=1 Tax=Desulfovibrio litoralis DSM 11393 TaxID=1121455 RepID=A0A1M7TBK3_9BACT|nr:TRAP transporter large permease subunit [Desulfovibrio litoralis]SHN68124.1 C4-dicarboxylate transporter, DctM subunit [Desulfovibrio litoralis DSM 11393]